ncbi:hypothetical protein LXA43DRAFT_1156523 [Ganoderma leucocontextum]|nr:hypothetical protein LXA43DRAFT_1156523 [Ganoderma leucocontextum]
METVTFADGRVAARGPDNAFLITTPNAAFIPEIVQGIVSVYLRDDGAFGKHDPTQWPQGVATATHPHAAIWALPSREQCICLPNTPVRGFGHFYPQFLRSLEPLVRGMSSRVRGYVPTMRSTVDLAHLRSYETGLTRAWERLQTICATYRDQLLQITMPFPNRQLMGAWTSQPEVAQGLFALGIPVWLVRASHLVSSGIRVCAFVAPSPTDALCHAKFHGEEPIYQGLAGEHHLAVMFAAQTYRDVSLVPTANIVDPDDYCALPRRDRLPHGHHGRVSVLQSGQRGGSSARDGPSSRGLRKDKAKPRYMPYNLLAQDRTNSVHPSQVRGRDKFLDVPHPWMPPSLPSWDVAMRAVDRSDQAKPAPEIWGYWIPEPALLLGPKDPVRLQRYVLNWLRAQPIWLYMLQVPGSGAVKVATQSWRNFLNGVPDDPNSTTKAGKRAFEIKQIFGRVFADQDLSPESATGEVEWHWSRLSAVDARLGPCIIWETFELGFRYELLHLDRFMRPVRSPEDIVAREALLARVFPSSSLWVVSHLPSEDSWGLFVPLPHRTVNSLNALRDMILRSDATLPLQLSDFLWLALFYTQTFFDVAGRAPIVPHRWPGLGPTLQNSQEASRLVEYSR